MSQLAKAFSEIKEDYLSTRQEAAHFKLGQFELLNAFGKQLAIQMWAITYVRTSVGFALVVSAQLPAFIPSVALFALITFYLRLPFGPLSRAFLTARLLLTLLLIADVCGFDLFKLAVFYAKNSPTVFVLAAMCVFTSLLFLLVAALNVFIRQTSQPRQASLAIISFYTIALMSFVIAVWTEDKFVEGWLSFVILLVSLLNFFMLWSREVPLSDLKN
jgi:hypothetical protein